MNQDRENHYLTFLIQ